MVPGSSTGGASMRRDNWTGADFGLSCAATLRRIDRRERGSLPARAAIGDEPVLGRNDVAGPQRRIVRHVERGEAERIFAVAGAVRNHLLAVDEGVVEIAIALAVLGDGAADFAAEEDLGLARRAHRPAGLDRRRVGHVLERKMPAVAQTDAKRHGVADGAAALADVFGPARRGRRDAADRGRRLGIGIHIGRRSLALGAAEQEIEQPFGARRARHRDQHGGEQRGQCGNVPI